MVEAMEAGSSGHAEDRIGDLERRVTDVEKSLRLSAGSSFAKLPAPSHEVVE